MNVIKATVKSGRLELHTPLDWPNGTEVLIEPTVAGSQGFGIDESQWRDDAESLADWDAGIKTIKPFDFTPEEAKTFAEFKERMRVHNIAAVERQMRESSGEWAATCWIRTSPRISSMIDLASAGGSMPPGGKDTESASARRSSASCGRASKEALRANATSITCVML